MKKQKHIGTEMTADAKTAITYAMHNVRHFLNKAEIEVESLMTLFNCDKYQITAYLMKGTELPEHTYSMILTLDQYFNLPQKTPTYEIIEDLYSDDTISKYDDRISSLEEEIEVLEEKAVLNHIWNEGVFYLYINDKNEENKMLSRYCTKTFYDVESHFYHLSEKRLELRLLKYKRNCLESLLKLITKKSHIKTSYEYKHWTLEAS